MDYMDGRKKPQAKLIGTDGNIFSLMGIASRALRSAGMGDKASEMTDRIMHCHSYDEALVIIMDYVEVV